MPHVTCSAPRTEAAAQAQRQEGLEALVVCMDPDAVARADPKPHALVDALGDGRGQARQHQSLEPARPLLLHQPQPGVLAQLLGLTGAKPPCHQRYHDPMPVHPHELVPCRGVAVQSSVDSCARVIVGQRLRRGTSHQSSNDPFTTS